MAPQHPDASSAAPLPFEPRLRAPHGQRPGLAPADALMRDLTAAPAPGTLERSVPRDRLPSAAVRPEGEPAASAQRPGNDAGGPDQAPSGARPVPPPREAPPTGPRPGGPAGPPAGASSPSEERTSDLSSLVRRIAARGRGAQRAGGIATPPPPPAPPAAAPAAPSAPASQDTDAAAPSASGSGRNVGTPLSQVTHPRTQYPLHFDLLMRDLFQRGEIPERYQVIAAEETRLDEHEMDVDFTILRLGSEEVFRRRVVVQQGRLVAIVDRPEPAR